MKTYTTTIGLEVHAELSTNSKMFCGCKNQPHESEPNAHTCPVCMAHPGTLPVPNKEAIAMVMTFGQAVGATRADYSEFDRKNYFYPDIPKAYQVSQYQFPFLTGGEINGVELTRVHLEEDTARSSHELTDSSLVDFNRAGVPLMELVTEPVIHDAATAGNFGRELQLLLQTLDISGANMERGEMRIEANISISDTDKLGTKVEVKNINSFKAVEAAIEYEVARQRKVLEAGDTLVQETRGWDENKNCTFSQRKKESAMEYRYFPDPDIPKIKTTEVADFSPESLTNRIPVLPAEKRLKYKKYRISDDIADIIISDRELDTLFAKVADLSEDSDLLSLTSNYLSVDMVRLRAEGVVDVASVPAELLLELMQITLKGDIGSRTTKDVLPKLPTLTGSVAEYVKEAGLVQLSDDSALLPVVADIISQNPTQVEELRSGKESVLKYLVGQGMKLTKGTANPQALEKLFLAEINK